MASAKILLYKNKKDKTHYPLALRITKDRKPKYIFLGVSLKESEWDQDKLRVIKTHPHAKRINNLVLKKLAEAGDLLLDNESQQKDVTVTQLKTQLKRENKSITFFQFADEYIENLKKQGKYRIAVTDKSRIKNFKDFFNSKDIFFQDVTVSTLEKFKVYLSPKCSNRTIVNHLIMIRALYNKAIKEGIVDKKHYPFGGDKIKIRIPQSIKIGLEESEIRAIENLELEKGTPIWHTRNIWLISFYFAGIRISDVFNMKWSDFANDRLYYKMGKNDKPVSVKIPKKVKEILEYYKKDKQIDTDYILPDLKSANQEDKKDLYIKNHTACRKANRHLKTIAELAKINKNLSNHIARHSFGNIAGDKISPQMLQKLYRHSDIKTTRGYQANFIHKDADEALDAVINF